MYHSTPTMMIVSTPKARNTPTIIPVTIRGLDRVTTTCQGDFHLGVPQSHLTARLPRYRGRGRTPNGGCGPCLGPVQLDRATSPRVTTQSREDPFRNGTGSTARRLIGTVEDSRRTNSGTAS
jgi:hypothetical protein